MTGFRKEYAERMATLLPRARALGLSEYQDIISVTDYPDPAIGPMDTQDGRYPLWYYALGVCGEAGEFAAKVDKLYPVSAVIGRFFIIALRAAATIGEMVDKVKKMYRNDGHAAREHSESDEITLHHFVTDVERTALGLELGDILWYVSRSAAKIGLTLEEVARMNVEKLSDRARRNVLRSQGDNR